MQRGDVIDAAGQSLSPSTPYLAHQRVFYYRAVVDEPRIPFEEHVVYQDDTLVVADKPHFLPVTPSGRYVQESLLVRLKRSLGIDTLAPMHRIDRETAGLVLFTIEPRTRDAYQALFRNRVVDKQYEAIAPLRVDLALPTVYRSRLIESDHFMRMREEPGEANSETGIALLEVCGALARYRLQPVSGQKHQLRVHMAALGIPIVNDRIYPSLYPDESETADYSRPLKLLARSICFTDPLTGLRREFRSRQVIEF